MNAKALEADPPEGFQPVTIGGTFATRSGPLFARWTGQHMLLGFRVQHQHVNPVDQCHGGMLSLFADMLLSTAGLHQTDMPRRFTPTVSLQMDFLAPSPLGAWIEGKADILRMTRTLIFTQGLVHADGKPVLRASGVFKIGPLLPDSSDNQTIFRDRAPASRA
jgi:uncharacterized protein (TIGR00369 family)